MAKGLGGGLEALIPPKSKKISFILPEGSRSRESVFLIEIEKVKTNPYQPRKEFDDRALQELSESIREFGILQPLIVSKEVSEFSHGSRVEYQLIAGERRLRAAKLAGFTQVPVIVRKPDAQKKLELSLVENIQRSDLNSIERAVAYKRLIDEFSLSHALVAERIGQSREAVSNTLRLLELPQEIQKLVREGRLSEGHARAVVSVGENEKRREMVKRILSETLSVRGAEELARTYKGKPARTLDADVVRFQKELHILFGEGKHVRILPSGSRHKLVITFPSKSELADFIERLRK